MINSEKATRQSELAILSQAIANSDDLIKQVQTLNFENRKLKQKYKSLSQSAVQVKHLYEQERDVGFQIGCQNADMKNKIDSLTRRNTELEHSRINMQLTHSQAIAEMEMKNAQEATISYATLKELVLQCKDWSEGDSKFKSVLKLAVDLLEKQGIDIDKMLLEKSNKRKSRQKSNDETIALHSEKYSMIFDKIIPIQLTDKVEKTYISVETNTETQEFCDKSTSYTSSTTTRGVSTDGLIGKVDVGTNFPELSPISFADIFKEMIIDIPVLLSPILDQTLKVNQSTQTEICYIIHDSPIEWKHSNTPSIGTITKLKNIRKSIIHCLNTHNVKKENFENDFEMSEQTFNPQLSQLWISLGKLLFGLIGNGNFLKNSAESIGEGSTWQKIQDISELIEARTVQENELKEPYLNQKTNRIELNHTLKLNFEKSMYTDEIFCDEKFDDCVLVPTQLEEEENGDLPINLSGQQTNELGATALPNQNCLIQDPVMENSLTNVKKPENMFCSEMFLLESTPCAFKKKAKLKNYDVISEQCNKILKSAERRRLNLLQLLSPIKDSPVQDSFCENTKKSFQTILSEQSVSDSCKSTSYKLQVFPLDKNGDGQSTNYIVESPSSPSPAEEESLFSIKIPADRKINTIRRPKSPSLNVGFRSTLNNIIDNYDQNKRLKVLKRNIEKNKELPRSSYNIEALRKSINQYLQQTWHNKTVQQLHNEFGAFAQNVDVVITAILETIEDSSDEPLNMKNTPPAPPLPLTHQKVLLVVESFPKFLKQKLLYELERKLFSFKAAEENDKIGALMSLAHFYIALSDIDTFEKRISNSRLFIYKALYYYNHKSFPLIYAMVATQPDCLPKRTLTNYQDEDALVLTIESILMNSPKDKMERNDFKKRDLRALLLTQYNYKPFQPSTNEIVILLSDRLKRNELKNLDYSFILLAKRYGYQWAMANIIRAHLYPLLEQLMIQSLQIEVHDDTVIYCLKIMSAILKTYPSNTDTTYFLQFFRTVLDRSKKYLIQEAAVEALLRLQRFGVVDIYQRIKYWNPSHRISHKLINMLNSFIYRKDIRFWRVLQLTN